MGNAQWHALQVRPHFERIVAVRLCERDTEAYLPLRKVARNGMHPSEAPLFPGYVFFKYDEMADASFSDVPGAVSVVRRTDGINIIPEHQITDLRRILAAGVSVQPWPFTSQGRIVMVQTGPMSGVTGILVDSTDRRLLVLSIPLIRRSIVIKINESHFVPALHSVRDRSGLISTDAGCGKSRTRQL